MVPNREGLGNQIKLVYLRYTESGHNWDPSYISDISHSKIARQLPIIGLILQRKYLCTNRNLLRSAFHFCLEILYSSWICKPIDDAVLIHYDSSVSCPIPHSSSHPDATMTIIKPHNITLQLHTYIVMNVFLQDCITNKVALASILYWCQTNYRT